MENDYINRIKTLFRNMTLNAVGADRDLLTLLQDKDISKALETMQNNDREVDKAVAEYNAQTHRVMYRANKHLADGTTYQTEKLPRNRQQYINEVELFFLFGNPVVWEKSSGDDDAYELFTDFLDECHFNSRMRQAKRLAGAETESAKLYRVYREEGEIKCDVVVLARSTGYKLRPLFDQYGNMLAFACGYQLNVSGNAIQYWDFYLKEMIFRCRQQPMGWSVEAIPNVLKKIPVIYYKQKKAWDGAVPRIDREEHLDSKIADTNNYFADPIAKATADVIDSLVANDRPGKLIQLRGPGATFEYVNPPQSSSTREAEKSDLNSSILFDTMTPDLSFENMRGLGSLSGVAIKNSLILGYIKRDLRKEVYEEMLSRERNLIVEILCLQHPEKAEQLRALKLKFSFAEPFASDEIANKQMIVQLYQSGLVSLDEAVHQLAICDHPETEIQRIKEDEEAKMQTQLAVQAQLANMKSQAVAPKEDNNPATANQIV